MAQGGSKGPKGRSSLSYPLWPTTNTALCRLCGTLCSCVLKGTTMGPAFTVSSKTTSCKVATPQAVGLVGSQCMANHSGMSSILGFASLTGNLIARPLVLGGWHVLHVMPRMPCNLTARLVSPWRMACHAWLHSTVELQTRQSMQ